MFGIGQFLCAGLKRSVASMLPWDIPWYDPSHMVFFVALYGALAVIGFGVIAALIITMRRMSKKEAEHH